MTSSRTRGGGPRMATGESPPESHELVVPSDTVVFTGGTCRAIYVGTGGDVATVLNGVALTYKNVPAGSYLSGYFSRVNLTGTTASNMIAVF